MVHASFRQLALALAAAAALSGAALAQTPTSGAGGKQTPTQPTANDPSVGLPSEPATMTKNPEAMSPDAARKDGTAPVKPGGK